MASSSWSRRTERHGAQWGRLSTSWTRRKWSGSCSTATTRAARTTTTSTLGRAPLGGAARGASREGGRPRRRDGAPGRPERAAPLPPRTRPYHGDRHGRGRRGKLGSPQTAIRCASPRKHTELRSEEHTSELQSRGHLVCRLLLEKKKIKNKDN